MDLGTDVGAVMIPANHAPSATAAAVNRVITSIAAVPIGDRS